MNKLLSICLLLSFGFTSIGFGQYGKQYTELAFEEDLIPEGIAIDAQSQKVYLNSLTKNKIVRCDLDGSNPEDFIFSNQYGYLSGFGMTVHGNLLYALGNSLPKNKNTSILLLLELPSGRLINAYPLKDAKTIYLNDIAISSNGRIFITDSESNNIYTLNESTDQLEVFYSNDEIKHSNGITIAPDNRFLYLATYTTGIRILDLHTLKLINGPNDHKGIDGMKFYNNQLLGLVNGKRKTSENGLYCFELNPEGSEIVGNQKILEFEDSSYIPTTFALFHNTLYFVEDTQLALLNQDTGQITDTARLKKYRLKRVDLLKLQKR